MKSIIQSVSRVGVLIAAASTALAALLSPARAADAGPATRPSATPFAVVELFTSEGCSSCPPADEVVAGLVADARKSAKAVYPISFHVDYWNNLGWKDRFSAASYTQRQYQYVNGLHLASAYTPQMVVNGQVEFVGNDGERAHAEIDAALKQLPQSIVSVHAAQNQGRVAVDYAVSGETAGRVINVVLVQRGLSTRVLRGENGNRTLRHENVARAMQTVPLQSGQPTGSVTLDLPGDTTPQAIEAGDLSVVVFVQDPGNLRISAAGSADIK